jgi:D-3-phosphoglycerate dehydrogenase / 2-oxoglutarate reductase
MKVLVADNLSSLGVDILKKESGIDVDVNTGLTKEELIKIIPDYEGLIVRSATKVTSEVIQAATNLKIVGRAGIGVDNIDVAAAGKKGIIVMNTPEGNIITTAEHTMALMLSMSRNIPQARSMLKDQKTWAPKKFMGKELHCKTLGIIGLGRIGTIVAERAKGFHMKILVHDPFISQEHAEKVGVEVVDLPDLLKRSDYLSLHTPSIDEKPLLSTKEFNMAKPGIRIVNCARGNLIDEGALIEAIKSKQVAQAALDVYVKEPLSPDSPLLNFDEIICTPHLGASTEEAQEKVAIAVADQIVDFLKNGNILNAVNMPSIDSDTLSKIEPYLKLGEDLGIFVSQLLDGPLTSVEVQYNGEVAEQRIDPVTISVLKGLLTQNIEGINMVNAPFIAKDRGIEIKESKSTEVREYTSTITVTAKTSVNKHSVTGSVFGKGDSRIVQFNEFHFEALLSKHMLVLTNMDVPGVIGKLGSALGTNKINIAGFHLGRVKEGDKAVAVINIDSQPDSETITALREIEGILNVSTVLL